MKKVFEGIKKIFSLVLFGIYFVFALVMTILLLNYNEYGITQFDNKSLIMINSKISNDEFKKGELIVKK